MDNGDRYFGTVAQGIYLTAISLGLFLFFIDDGTVFPAVHAFMGALTAPVIFYWLSGVGGLFFIGFMLMAIKMKRPLLFLINTLIAGLLFCYWHVLHTTPLF